MLLAKCLCRTFAASNRTSTGVGFTIRFGPRHVARASLFGRFARNGFFAFTFCATFDGCWLRRFISGTCIKAQLVAHNLTADFVNFARLNLAQLERTIADADQTVHA